MERAQTPNQQPSLLPPPQPPPSEPSNIISDTPMLQDSNEWLPNGPAVPPPSLEPATQQPISNQPASSPPPPFAPWTSTATPPTTIPPFMEGNSILPSTPSRADTPGDSSPNGGGIRPLNVKDALSYLEMVKVRFQDKPDVYNHFLDIMKDFKSQAIDTPGVIERVSTLFTGHMSLIQGFNTFLPQGYRIECSSDGQETNLITVTTPTGTTTSTSHSQGGVGTLSRIASTSANLPVPVLSVYGIAPSPGFGPIDGPSTPLTQLPNPLSPTLGPLHPSTPSGSGVGAAILGGLHNQPSALKGPPALPVPAPEFNHAIQYVNKIKNRFADDPDTYKQFLEILQTYQKEQRPIQDVYAQVTILFKNAHDLLEEFKQFLPDTSGNVPASGGLFNMIAAATPSGTGNISMDVMDGKDKAKKNGTSGGATTSTADKSAASQKRKKRALEKDLAAAPKAGQSKPKKIKHHHSKPFLSPELFAAESHNQTPPRQLPPSTHHQSSRHHHHHTTESQTAYVPDLPDEAAFFDRVKRSIDDRTTYHEFLKLLNLFVQEIIDIRTLVDRAREFLSESLYAQFKEILGWDDRHLVEVEGAGPGVKGVLGVVGALERPKVDLNACRRYGPSYRKLPKNEVMLACSGRDAMCWEVLNDEWISHPQWAAEETGFSTHKKNLYEEALHRSEEERHEYDFHIEAITRTIQVLEPISARINMMDAEERATFKLKPGLGGQGKSIYQRIIKKVYGREHGLEVIAALHDSPAISVPVVLARLKQKEEEWKRAQREWNKVWREVDARNFYKSLDHQGTIFKGNDKKLVTPKQLVMDIENKVKEQARDRRDLVDPATYGRFIPKWQFSFKVEDWTTLQDCLKLVFSFLDRMGSSQMGRVEREKIESFLRPFMPLFFMINPTDFDAGLEAASSPVMGNDDLESEIGERDEVGSVMDDTEDGASVAGSSAGSRRGGRRGGASGGVPAVDLRKKLLKSAQEKGRKTRVNGKESAANSSRASPAPLSTDQMQVDTSEPNSPSPLITTFAPAITTDTATAPPPTWVKVDNSEGVGKVVEVDEEKRPKKGTFFCNNQFYVLLRLIQILYQRLHSCRTLAQQLASDPSKSYLANPVAVELGLYDSLGPPATRQVTSGPNPAIKFYDHLLQCCEELFDGDMDQSTFEDNLRFMFGTRAYLMFSVDKVIGHLVKQVQVVLADAKSQELMALLRRDRSLDTFNVQEQINQRRQAEAIVSAEDNLYRIDWFNDTKALRIQLLDKNDGSVDDPQTLMQKWRQYTDSYVLSHKTEGIRTSVKPPILERTLEPNSSSIRLGSSNFVSRGDLRIKVALRTYRLFFVPNTEDSFCRKRSKEELEATAKQSEERRKERKERWEKWLEQKVGNTGTGSSTS